MGQEATAAKVLVETPEQKLARLEAENTALKAQAAMNRGMGTFRLAVSQARATGTKGPTDKGAKGGCLSMYGVGRFGLHLYREQVEKVLDHADEIRKFIAEHAAELSVKA